MYKMLNKVQYYAWGSPTLLPSMYNIPNPQQLPIAELWMGAHPAHSSLIIDQQGQQHSLYEWIKSDPVTNLGEKSAQRFNGLPFLFKVLCAEQPLSIQVHPGKQAAETGYMREEQATIPLNSSKRNYKDSNHKPELIYAITPFHAMNGFRPVAEIAHLLHAFSSVHPDIASFIKQPAEESLAKLFVCLLTLIGGEKRDALALLKSTAASKTEEPWQTVTQIANYYPQDNGLFAPLLLNVVTLQPGEAMFLAAGTPHAYLHGIGLEAMANSDNVLRAGLTPKHIDIAELLQNLHTVSHPASELYLKSEQIEAVSYFPVPTADFAFAIHQVSNQVQRIEPQSATLLFAIEGNQQIYQRGTMLELQPGESCYIAACEAPAEIIGDGRIARVYNVS